MGVGRPTKLTPEVSDAVCKDVALGVPLRYAAPRAGVTPQTLSEWKSRGRDGEEPYAEFLEAVKKAEADAIARNAATINAAARGSVVTKRVTTTDPNGATRTVEEFHPPQWTAGAWFLERRAPDEFGRDVSELKTLRREVEELRKVAEPGRATGPAVDLSKYLNDPVGYAREVLKVTPTPDQEAIARAVLDPPYRVFVESGHNVGKTFLAAWLVNWWYDTRDPSWAITTAPTFESVKDILWTEIRLARERAGLSSDLAPSNPVMKSGVDHLAKGYTASKGESFQGRHREKMFFVFDEAEGVDAVYWKTAVTMFRPGGEDAFLAIMNPTTTTSQAYIEKQATNPDGSPKWRIFSLSAMNHPNIAAGLLNREKAARGEPEDPLPVPSAVTLDQLESWIADWFESVNTGEQDAATDVEFPPASGRWWRPDPDGESRVLGRRPTAGSYGVWSEKVWDRAAKPEVPLGWALGELPELGCDVAGFGVDKTEIHGRCGPASLLHEDHGGWDTVQVADRLMQLADELAKWANDRRDRAAAPVSGKDIRIKVDDTGVGFGVSSILADKGCNVVRVNAGEAADRSDKYPRVRDELWFQTRDRAKEGKLDLSRLPAKRLAQIKAQALSPVWWPTTDRRRQVEPKHDTKKRIGRSPDGMDAINLAYYEAGGGVPGLVENTRSRDRRGY